MLLVVQNLELAYELMVEKLVLTNSQIKELFEVSSNASISKIKKASAGRND